MRIIFGLVPYLCLLALTAGLASCQKTEQEKRSLGPGESSASSNALPAPGFETPNQPTAPAGSNPPPTPPVVLDSGPPYELVLTVPFDQPSWNLSMAGATVDLEIFSRSSVSSFLDAPPIRVLDQPAQTAPYLIAIPAIPQNMKIRVTIA